MKQLSRILVEVPPSPPKGLAATTWEQRKEMTVKQLIEAMGSLHVHHKDFQERPRSLLPMPNLAGRQPVFEYSDPGFWSIIKMFLQWAAR